MTKAEHDFIQLIRLAIGQSSLLSEYIEWDQVWKLAQRNYMETILYIAAKSYGNIPLTVLDIMKKSAEQMTARAAMQGYCIKRVESMLKAANVPYGIQKGGILREDYPKISMRYMSDIDFYIRPEDRKRIRTLMEEINIRYVDSDSGDEKFCMTDCVGVEFHGRLLYRRTKNGIENYPDFSFVNESGQRLTENGFALNLIGHAVYDLSMGGPGIRYILDLWIYRHRHANMPKWEDVKKRLENDGIAEAANNLMDLAEYLFGDKEETPLLKEMAEYVLKSGLKGDSKREAASEYALAGGKGEALFRQIFRNRAEFENRYPWLKRYVFLYPVAWMLRLIKSSRNHKSELDKWKEKRAEISEDEIIEQRKLLSRFGL